MTLKEKQIIKTYSAVQMNKLSHSFGIGYMRRQILQSISFDVFSGEVVLLTGPSGCGKTTLLTLIGALRKVQEGSLEVLGCQLKNSDRSTRQKLRKSIGMIFQEQNL